jgi:hypothetical protein
MTALHDVDAIDILNNVPTARKELVTLYQIVLLHLSIIAVQLVSFAALKPH